MADPIPLKPGVIVDTDDERELLDYFMGKLRKFREDHAVLPEMVAVVLIGKNEAGSLASLCHSWAPGASNRTRLETCSMASVLLAKRAVRED